MSGGGGDAGGRVGCVRGGPGGGSASAGGAAVSALGAGGSLPVARAGARHSSLLF